MIRNLLGPRPRKVKCRFVTQTIPLGPLLRVTSACLAISPWPKYPKSRPHPPNHRPEQGASFGVVTHRTPLNPASISPNLYAHPSAPPSAPPAARSPTPSPLGHCRFTLAQIPEYGPRPPNNGPGKSLPPLRNHAQKITKPFPISLILYARPSAPPSAPPAAQPIAPFPLSKPPRSR